MSRVSIDAAGLRALRQHALAAGTLDNWAELALEWADAAEVEIARVRADGEQMRKNWLTLQNATGEQCLHAALGMDKGWTAQHPG